MIVVKGTKIKAIRKFSLARKIKLMNSFAMRVCARIYMYVLVKRIFVVVLYGQQVVQVQQETKND